MELNNEQVKKFVEIHKPYGGLGDLSEIQIRQLAQGLANYYLVLFNIHKRIERENGYGNNK